MRGTEKNLVILDRISYNQEKQYIKEPAITKVLDFGNGWINVLMNDGHEYHRVGGSLSWRYNNPGNIKFGSYARSQGAIGRGWGGQGGHAVFPTYKIGAMAKKTLLFTPIRKYYNMTLSEAISYYAPSSDPNANNRPDIYARFILKRVPGVTLNTTLKNFNELQQDQMLMAMEKFEGFKIGKIERIG